MTEETNNTPTPAAGEAGQAPKAKSGLIKYAIFGVAGIVLVAGIAFGTLMLVGAGSAPAPEAVADSTEIITHSEPAGDSTAAEHHAEHPDAHPTPPATRAAAATAQQDSALAWMDQDPSVLDDIMKSLEVLDYKPSDAEVRTESAMSTEDSTATANFLAEEEKRLAALEDSLNAREKRLNALDAKLSQQILKIEQAESSRIIKLAKLYDGMEPRSVAQLCANLDDATVVSLLPRMNVKNASQVLALLPPARAARLSKQMITIAEN